MDFCYNKLEKHKHKRDKMRLWCKNIPYTCVEHTKSNWGSTYIYAPLGT